MTWRTIVKRGAAPAPTKKKIVTTDTCWSVLGEEEDREPTVLMETPTTKSAPPSVSTAKTRRRRRGKSKGTGEGGGVPVEDGVVTEDDISVEDHVAQETNKAAMNGFLWYQVGLTISLKHATELTRLVPTDHMANIVHTLVSLVSSSLEVKSEVDLTDDLAAVDRFLQSSKRHLARDRLLGKLLLNSLNQSLSLTMHGHNILERMNHLVGHDVVELVVSTMAVTMKKCIGCLRAGSKRCTSKCCMWEDCLAHKLKAMRIPTRLVTEHSWVDAQGDE